VKKFESTIDFLYPVLAGATRTAKARFTIANPEGELKPQMYTDVEIFIDLGSRLAVPESAVINTGTRQIIYVDKGDGNFEPRDVTTGIRAEGLIEVTTGVEAGDQVASEANFLIDSEARLKGVVQ
jgi:Cu(I)/Ag(I) efflux system membrane fusion protein